MSNFNPYQPPAEPASPTAPSIPAFNAGPSGLGGWLILVGFGAVLSPLTTLKQIAALKILFLDGTWETLTLPGSEAYHSFWAPLLIGEMAFNVISFVVWSYMIFLFFAKKKAYPKWYIWAHLCTLAVVIADTCALQLVRPDLPLLDPGTSREIFRSLVAVCIWIPYMLVSKRVAATFTY